jgi:competence protein ComEC
MAAEGETMHFEHVTERVAAVWARSAAGLRRGHARACDVWAAARSHLRSDPLPCRPLVLVAALFAAGCAGVRILPAVPGGWAVPAWAAAACGLGAWIIGSGCGRMRAATIGLQAAIICLGAAWSAARFDLFRVDELAWHLGDTPIPVAVEGTIVEPARSLPTPAGDPRRAAAIGPASECVVAVERIRHRSRWRSASGRAALVIDGAAPDLVPGSRVRVLGRGLRPAPAFNPGEFDFQVRARSKRCLAIVRTRAADVRVLSEPAWWWPPVVLERVRRQGEAVFERHIAPQRAALAAALLLGRRDALPREDTDDFLVTGTVHILSISGLHVGLLALGLFRVLRLACVPRRWTLAAVAMVTGLYMLLVQAETPVVRATLLVWLACVAAAVGRRATAINGLAVAALVVLACRPGEVFSTGAQLSFFSTAVLVGAARLLPPQRGPTDPIDRLIERSRSPAERMARRCGWNVWTLFAAGAAVWLATAPLVAARFHVVSPVGLVLNVLVAPFVALAMGCGLGCLLAAPCSPLVAGWCGAGCDATLACVGWLVSCGAAVPGGHAWVAGPPAWWVAGWYAVLGAALVALPRPRLARAATWAAVAGGWAAVGVAGYGLERLMEGGPREMRVVVAAMGHGCGIVVRSPTGRCLVYDAGRLGAPGAARRAMAAVLWDEGVSRIDTLVVSHADADHFNAVPELLERFGVGEIVVTEAFCSSPSGGVADLLDRAAARRVPVRTVRAGDSFAVDPLCRVRVLRDGAGQAAAADNERSLVLGVEAAGRRLLLTGDLEGPALADFVAAGPDACDVLVAPHHGTRTSLPPDIARATRPGLVLVSGVGGPAWGEVSAAYRDAAGDAAVLKTGGEGAIAVTLTAAGVTVERFTNGRWRPCGPDDSARTIGKKETSTAPRTAGSKSSSTTDPTPPGTTPLRKRTVS